MMAAITAGVGAIRYSGVPASGKQIPNCQILEGGLFGTNKKGAVCG